MPQRKSPPLPPAVAASILCIGLALIPSVWVSWVAPLARAIVLPALAILVLSFRLTHRVMQNPRTGEAGHAAGDGRKFSFRPRGGIGDGRIGWAGGPTLLVLLYFAWAAVSAVRAGGAPRSAADFGVVPGAAALPFARGELLRLMGGVAIYLAVATSARRWEQACRCVDAFLAALLGATLIAFISHNGDDAVLRGPFGNSQLLAAFVLQLMPLALVIATAARNGRRRILAQIASVLALAALALAQTRSAWIGGLATMAVLAWLLSQLPRRRRRRWSREPSRQWPVRTGAGAPFLAAAGLALATLGWLVCETDLSGPVVARAATLLRLSDDTSAVWRRHQWQVALALARSRPLTGHGLGTYPLISAPRLPRPIPLAVARVVGPNLSLNAHSLYLQMLAETGAIGLALYLLLVGNFLSGGLRACRHGGSRARSLVLVGCMAGITGQAVDALANPAYQFTEISLFFWAILGLGTAMMRAAPKTTEPGSSSGAGAALDLPGHSAARKPRGLLRPLVACLATGALVAGSVAGAPPPLNNASYMPFQSFRIDAHTTPGYVLQTLLPGECVELRAIGTTYGGQEEDATAETTFTRSGGTAPPDCLQQLPPPNSNLFCLRTGAPASYNGLTVQLQGTLDFNSQTLTAVCAPICLSVPEAQPQVSLTAEPQVISPTGDLVEIEVQYQAGDLHFQRLQKVTANETLEPGDVQILDDTHVMLRAASTFPEHRIYTLLYLFRDQHHRAWTTRAEVYVR